MIYFNTFRLDTGSPTAIQSSQPSEATDPTKDLMSYMYIIQYGNLPIYDMTDTTKKWVLDLECNDIDWCNIFISDCTHQLNRQT